MVDSTSSAAWARTSRTARFSSGSGREGGGRGRRFMVGMVSVLLRSLSMMSRGSDNATLPDMSWMFHVRCGSRSTRS